MREAERRGKETVRRIEEWRRERICREVGKQMGKRERNERNEESTEKQESPKARRGIHKRRKNGNRAVRLIVSL